MCAAEEMIRGLAQVPWERVDVSFQKSRQRYVAHNTIQAWILLFCLAFALITISIKNNFLNQECLDSSTIYYILTLET